MAFTLDTDMHDELKEILEELKYIDTDWILSQPIPEDALYVYDGENNILGLIAMVLDKRLRKYYKNEKTVSWMVYDSRVWRETHTDFARSVFVEATKRVATYCNSMIKRIERESEISEEAAVQSVLAEDETLSGDDLRLRIREIMFGERGTLSGETVIVSFHTSKRKSWRQMVDSMLHCSVGSLMIYLCVSLSSLTN